VLIQEFVHSHTHTSFVSITVSHHYNQAIT
jgi:hypothetical protein